MLGPGAVELISDPPAVELDVEVDYSFVQSLSQIDGYLFVVGGTCQSNQSNQIKSNGFFLEDDFT